MSNSKNGICCDVDDWPSINLSSQIIYSIIFVIGILVNFTFIYNIVRFPKMDVNTNLYTVNLTIADLIFLFSIPFLVITINLRNWVFGKFICKVFAISVNQFTSSFFMMIIVINHYFIKQYSIPIPKISANKMLIISWTFSAVCMLPVFLYADIEDKNDVTICNILWSYEFMETIFISYSFILGFLLPLICHLTFHRLLILYMKKKDAEEKSKGKYLNTKFICQVLSTLILFILRKLPFWIIQTLMFTSLECQMSIMNIFLVSCLIYCTCFINPILYFFFNNNNFF